MSQTAEDSADGEQGPILVVRTRARDTMLGIN